MSRKTKKTEAVNVYTDHVAGLQYHDYQRINIKAGDPVVLKREANNPHDRNAIAVYIHDTKVGYIKGTQCPRLLGIKRDGGRFASSVVSFNKNNPSWQALVIRVDVTMPTVEEITDNEVL